MVDNTNLNRNEAKQLLDKWQDTYQQASEKVKQKAGEFKEQAKETTTDASHALGAIAFYAFITMILGAIATIIGSVIGIRCCRKNYVVK